MHQELEEIITTVLYNQDPLVQMHYLSEVSYHNTVYPIVAFTIGTKNTSAPTLALVGGVHGLEGIGSSVVLSYLKSIINQLSWDSKFREQFQFSRIVFLPIVNPYGIENFRRSNGNGVDLMRNSPIEGEKDSFWKIYRGHTFGNSLPWFRGDPQNMEVEAKSLCYLIEKEVFPAKTSLVIDFHSGFGMMDRLWFPYAKNNDRFPYYDQAKEIEKLLNFTHPHHVYHIEPQSASYTTHGDLWDYLTDKFNESEYSKDNIFLPWTLEMGSWNWLKKNPIQIFNKYGVFNPMVQHRFDRTMRRHFVLIQFFYRLVLNRGAWDKE